MIFKNLFLIFLLSIISSCSSIPLNSTDNQKRILGKFSFFSSTDYLSGKLMLSKDENISQLKLSISGVPRSFLITEYKNADSFNYKYNFNESLDVSPVKSLIENISISKLMFWLLIKCDLEDCKPFLKGNISIKKKEFFKNGKIKKVVGKSDKYQFALILKS
jgi:hypothetical protein